jgi:hypothetical protein
MSPECVAKNELTGGARCLPAFRIFSLRSGNRGIPGSFLSSVIDCTFNGNLSKLIKASLDLSGTVGFLDSVGCKSQQRDLLDEPTLTHLFFPSSLPAVDVLSREQEKLLCDNL